MRLAVDDEKRVGGLSCVHSRSTFHDNFDGDGLHAHARRNERRYPIPFL